MHLFTYELKFNYSRILINVNKDLYNADFKLMIDTNKTLQ